MRTAWNRGRPWSDEVKKKISERKKGTEPWNKNKKTGRPSWNSGKSLSAEHKKKISERMKHVKNLERNTTSGE